MYKLKDICSLITDKISINELINANLLYVSTENMLPNKCGIVPPTSTPTECKVTAYRKDDILVSNIRPYFKKIWFALNDGGCSNDVLVFRARADISSIFLHYILANDAFFDYATQTSKGTKMPRGDKKAIMEYEVPEMDYEKQQQSTIILHLIDEKIAINTTINENLEQQATLLYDYFLEKALPDKSKVGTLADIADVSSGKRPPMKSAIMTEENNIPIVGAADVMGFTNEFNHNNKILVIGRVGTHGVVQRMNFPCWTSDNTLIITSKFYEFLYQILKRIDYHSLNRGSTQPLITQGDIKKVPIIIPNEEMLVEYETIVSTLMSKYEANRTENIRLATLRDTLLPKLMNGEIDVSKITI